VSCAGASPGARTLPRQWLAMGQALSTHSEDPLYTCGGGRVCCAKVTVTESYSHTVAESTCESLGFWCDSQPCPGRSCLATGAFISRGDFRRASLASLNRARLMPCCRRLPSSSSTGSLPRCLGLRSRLLHIYGQAAVHVGVGAWVGAVALALGIVRPERRLRCGFGPGAAAIATAAAARAASAKACFCSHAEPLS
jgi:hypothetical protein